MSKKSIDWTFVQTVYRLGALSNRELGRVAGCSEATIRERAKKEGWERDLAGEVDSDKPPLMPAGSEADYIEQIGAAIANVVRSHRADVLRLRKTVSTLERYVASLMERVPASKTPADDLVKASSALMRIAIAHSKLIPLERQAFNISEGYFVRSEQEQEEWDDDFILREAEIIKLKRQMEAEGKL